LSRLLYSVAWWLALPLVLARLWRRGRAEPGYRRHVAERLGFYADSGGSSASAADAAAPLIWVHAVSVGETRAAAPLIEALLATYPQHTVLLTHMTATGRATGAALFAQYGARVRQCYLPYDTGWMAARFLAHFAPRLGVLMETEVWPNLLAQCVRQQVPVALVNARLSARSLARGQRLSGLIGPAARSLACVAAQTTADAERIAWLGARNVHVTGSLKFDVAPPATAAALGAALRQQIGTRLVLLCASTRDGEEALILAALRHCDLGDTLLLLVPRHPQRFDQVAQLIAAEGFTLARRSVLGDAVLGSQIQVLLGDSMGEMFTYFAASDVAFIGGSLLPFGGQNLIEACALGKPVLLGPHTFNFSAVSADAIAAGAALRVADAAQLVEVAQRLLHADTERETMGRRALQFALQHRGATQRTMALLQPLLD
jgi:3-deoxy-D-manno-octulosonic-acid transferase